MYQFGGGDLTVAQQYHALRFSAAFPGGSGSVGHNVLRWRVGVTPSPVSRLYTLGISYKPPDTPNIHVFDPNLIDLAGGRRLPHVYEQEPTQLCLFLPGSGQWRRSLLIERTMLPWSVLWLFYFEEWLASNEWKGGGVHPSAG
jgi:hypothetical protein